MGTIRDEIRQTRPFASAAEEAVVTLVATVDRVRAALSAALASHGLTVQQYNVLRILRGAGGDGLPTLDVAARMIERSPGITRLLGRLEARRLVRRLRSREDRRQVICHATPLALALLARLERPMAEAAQLCLAPLDAGRTQLLVGMLDEIRAAAKLAAHDQTEPEAEKEKTR